MDRMGTGAWKRFLFPFLYREENEQNLVSSARICYYLRGIFDFDILRGNIWKNIGKQICGI